MRDAINELNKNSIAKATGISYSRLRKYASGLIRDLTKDECDKIYKYLITLATQFKTN
jgi:hypothetical protein